MIPLVKELARSAAEELVRLWGPRVGRKDLAEFVDNLVDRGLGQSVDDDDVDDDELSLLVSRGYILRDGKVCVWDVADHPDFSEAFMDALWEFAQRYMGELKRDDSVIPLFRAKV